MGKFVTFLIHGHYKITIHIGSVTFGVFIIIDHSSDLVYQQPTYFNYRPNSSSFMGPKPSSLQVPEIGTNELPMLPWELLERIIQFLDAEAFFLTLPLVCTSFGNLCKNNILYEKYAFYGNRRIHSIFQLFSEMQNIQEPRYFRPNVNFHLEGITQLAEIRIDVFTTSDSKEIHLDEVSSMVIDLSILNDTSDNVHTKASEFLEKLFESPPEKLKNLKLSGFRVDASLLGSLSKLRLDWLHLTCLLLKYFKYDPNSFLGFRRLHLKLKENCASYLFPSLPASLEELSLHLLNQSKNDLLMYVDHCKSLKKM